MEYYSSKTINLIYIT